MRKLKLKKEKTVERKDYYNDLENRERVLKKAREILEDENVFRLLKHIVVKSDDLQEELIYIIAGYLVSIDTLDRIKDRNKRIKERINIKNSLTKFLYDVYDVLNPNVNTLVFTLLFELNEFLSRYCDTAINRYEQFMVKEGKIDNYNIVKNSFLVIDDKPVTDNFNEILGYETAFDKTLTARFQSCLDWIASALKRGQKYNSTVVTKENLDKLLNNDLDKIKQSFEKKMYFSEDTHSKLEKEIALFKEFYSRIHLVKLLLEKSENEKMNNKHLSAIDKITKKKDISQLRATVTRVDNLLKDLYELIDLGEITGKRILNVA